MVFVFLFRPEIQYWVTNCQILLGRLIFHDFEFFVQNTSTLIRKFGKLGYVPEIFLPKEIWQAFVWVTTSNTLSINVVKHLTMTFYLPSEIKKIFLLISQKSRSTDRNQDLYKVETIIHDSDWTLLIRVSGLLYRPNYTKYVAPYNRQDAAIEAKIINDKNQWIITMMIMLNLFFR